MSKDNFRTGIAFGIVLGTMLTALWATYLRDRGRDECDNKLLRSEKCIQIWVPESTAKKQGGAV